MRTTVISGAILIGMLMSCAGQVDEPVGDDDMPGIDGGTGDDVEPEQRPDLDFGTWIIDNVSDTPASMGFHGAHAISSDGDDWIVWAESDEEQILDMDIRAARKDGLEWTSLELTDVPGVQNTFPSLVADGDTMLVAYNGRLPDSDNDIFVATTGGLEWSEAVDVTTGFEASDLRRDFYPVAVAGAGERAVAYLSTPIDADRDALGPPDIRVLSLSDGAQPQTALAGDPARPCGMFDAAIDSSGAHHIVAACGAQSATQLWYATDESGSWRSELLFGGVLAMLPSVTADADGELHLVWRSDVACATGSCGELFYSRRSAGAFSDPVIVGNTPDVFDISAAVGVDSFGRVIIAYSSKVTADDSDIFLSWSEDGTSFSGSRNITNTPGSSEQSPRITFDPRDSAPSITFETVFRGSEPLNVDIFRAKLVP